MRILESFCLFLFGSYVKSMALESNETVSLVKRRRSLGIFKTVCYPGLGCFYTGPPFKNIPNRIVSLPPLPQEVIRTIYLLFTRKNRNNPLSFSPENHELLLKSNFNSSAWTRIIIHGYTDGTYASAWLFDMKDEFLRISDDNVIAVDHPTTFLFPRIIYPQSVADCRVIGVQVANLITFLHEKFGADLKKIHLIGHSLGAQIGGYAGELLPNLGRITGLDPAGPYFRNVANNVKLDDSDAMFVDVIHSNPSAILGFGTNEDVGHINFWPNGGKQRGCPLTIARILANGILPFERRFYLFMIF
ncbi:pancreatic lipase-related protein 2 [Nephila pilipes]|uniref:Pancreatic lipase-related protein 2 n=1 Tax=Nephila pilipes TaxID=299642 RepID=A0A8X6UD43_NEPPI|nr:pancreatic lipase-related protein 2 [Nephila pilipes]